MYGRTQILAVQYTLSGYSHIIGRSTIRATSGTEKTLAAIKILEEAE